MGANDNTKALDNAQNAKYMNWVFDIFGKFIIFALKMFLRD